MKRTIKPLGSLIVGYVLVIVSIILLIFGITFLSIGLIEDKNFIEAEATVKTIINNEEERYINISFEVDGNVVNTRYPFFNKELDVGDKVKIKYNPNNYDDVIARNKGYLLTSSIVISVSLFMFLYNLFIILGYYKEKNRINKIILNGKKYQANIICVEENNKNTSFGKVPYIIVCEIKVNDIKYVLTSKDVFIDANINGYVGHKIDVYTIDDEFKEYYIDYLKVE